MSSDVQLSWLPVSKCHLLEPATVGLSPAQAPSQGHPAPEHWKCLHRRATSGIGLLHPRPVKGLPVMSTGVGRGCGNTGSQPPSLTHSACLTLGQGTYLQPMFSMLGLSGLETGSDSQPLIWAFGWMSLRLG